MINNNPQRRIIHPHHVLPKNSQNCSYKAKDVYNNPKIIPYNDWFAKINGMRITMDIESNTLYQGNIPLQYDEYIRAWVIPKNIQENCIDRL